MGNFYATFAVTSVITAIAVYTAPQLLPERFSRVVIRFFLIDFGLAVLYSVFIWPFFINPLRHIPGPTVSHNPIPAPLKLVLKLYRATTSSTAMAQHNFPSHRAKKCSTGYRIFLMTASSASEDSSTKTASSPLRPKP